MQTDRQLIVLRHNTKGKDEKVIPRKTVKIERSDKISPLLCFKDTRKSRLWSLNN